MNKEKHAMNCEREPFGSSRAVLLAVTIVCILVVVAANLVMVASKASAEAVIGTTGSGSSQVLHPQGIAVDQTEGLLYVADTDNNRIDVFEASTGQFVKAFGWGVADGTSNQLQVCTTTCFKGIQGSGSGQLDRVTGVAVDNDPSSIAYHSVYTFENDNGAQPDHRVQRFTPAGVFVWMVGGQVNKTTNGNLCTAASGNVCGASNDQVEAGENLGNLEGHFNSPAGGGAGSSVVAVGSAGTVYVADQVEPTLTLPRKTRVQKFAPSGAYLGQQLFEVANVGRTTALALDSSDDVYIGSAGEKGAVRKYSPAGTELYSLDHPSFNISALAVDSGDNLYVADNSDTTIPPDLEGSSSILEYNSTGTEIRAFYGQLEAVRVRGLVSYPNPSGDIFASEEPSLVRTGRILDISLPPAGPLVYPRASTNVASPVSSTKATIHGKVNPEGEATTYHFQYITDEAFHADGEAFGAGTLETSEAGPIGPDFNLRPDFNLHAASASLTGLFPETLYHFRLIAKSSAAPAGNAGPEGTFETKEPLEFGETWSTDVSTEAATLRIEVNPLGTHATGRFEVVEQSKFEASGYAEAEVAPALAEEPVNLGEGEAMKEFHTLISGLRAGATYRFRFVATDRCHPEPAPLCEFTAPEGSFTTFAPIPPIVGCPNDGFREAGSGEFLPDCRGYEMVSPVDKNGANVEPVFNISGFPAGLDQAAVDGNSITYSTYKAFGNITSAPYTNQYLARRSAGGWTTEAISPKREGPSIMTFLSAELDRQYKAFSGDLCQGWVVQDANPTLAPGGVEGFPGLYRRKDCGTDIGSYEALMTAEPPNLAPRKVIPELQGTSTDGSVAVFSLNDNLTPDAPAQSQECVEETNPSSEPCLARVYESRGGQLKLVCILPDETPYAGACGVGSPGGSGAADRAAMITHAVSKDGSRIFWTAAKSGTGKLYVRIGGTETIEISSSANAQFWAAAADGSKAIYSVGESLFEYDVAGEEAHLIAGGFKGVAGASDDASRIYFVSTTVLTGEEENSSGAKAAAGKPNLYLYEHGGGFRFVGTLAASDLESALQPSSPISRSPAAHLSRVTPDGERLAFMSSAPLTSYDNKDASSGEPVMEVYLYDAAAEAGAGSVLCPSCNPSNARPEGRVLSQKLLESRFAAARIPTFESQLYGQHVLSDDGTRLYFDSFESLVSSDTNEEEDVYQWEVPGAGSCTAQSPTFQASSGGCLDLISSGASPQGSELTDISADGDNVFFKTTQSLVPQDPGLRDIYDARVEGGFPPLPPRPVICQGERCLGKAKPAPEEVAPASRLPGPGNPPAPPLQVHCRKGSHKVKRHGHVRCVPNGNKHKKHQRRKIHKSGRAAR